MDLKSLVDKDLQGWSLQKISILVTTDYDGHAISGTKKFFKNEKIPAALASNDNYLKTYNAIVLTNGEKIILIEENSEIFDYENEDKQQLELQESIMKKLTKEERAILGIKN